EVLAGSHTRHDTPPSQAPSPIFSHSSAKKGVQPNDVLLSRIVPHIRRTWVVAPSRNAERQIASGEWIVFRGDDFVPEYLARVLISDFFHAQFMQTVTGVGGSLSRANPKAVAEIRIPLPRLEVQREIVAEVEGYQRVIDGARAVLDNYRPHIPVDPEWQTNELQNLVDTVTPPLKLQTSEYATTGEIPIIDQSQDYIAGWTNQSAAAIDPQDGLVVFGDHTCAVKFVDRPFAQGADGIKILRTRQALLPKYLALYLQAYPLAQDGYRRHFSKLKEYPIRFPELDVQQAIVTEIEAEQALVNGNRDLIDRFEKKIDAAIARVWGEAKAEGAA
ncbi:hypothetical protein ACFOM8_21450, partial [Paracoccus angustae]